MAQPNLPAQQGAANKALTLQQKRARKLITILTEDHNFDVVDKIVDLYRRVAKARIKPVEKYKLEYNILAQILQYAYPKLQAIESDIKAGEQVVFNIQVGAPPPQPPPRKIQGKAKTVDIPAIKGPDGVFTVDMKGVGKK